VDMDINAMGSTGWWLDKWLYFLCFSVLKCLCNEWIL